MNTISQKERDKARFAMICASAEQDPALACRVADSYRRGTDGFPLHPRRAFRWYARSALGGDAEGQNNLGVCYELGFGCRGSMDKAFYWYRRAAGQGMATAIGNVGLCYRYGRGVSVDLEEARRWLKRAVDLGNRVSIRHLAEISRDVNATGRAIVRDGSDGLPPVIDVTGLGIIFEPPEDESR